jgi:O-antigen/teichoic acid export membrane protein
LYALVAINALVGIVIIVLKLVYLNRTTAIKIDFKFKSKELSKELFGFSIWITVIGIAQRLLINLAPTLLGVFSGTTQIAIFSIGIIIEGYVWTFANALNGLFLPKVAALTSIHDNRDAVTNLMIRVGRLQLIMVGLLFIGLICLGKEFITLWMGSDFSESYFIILFLILPSFFTLTQEIASTLLYVENEVKYKAILFISASILSIVIGSFLIPKTGALGAAIGISISLFLFHVIGMNIVYVKIMRLDIFLFFKECYLKMALPLGLTLTAGLIINSYIPAVHFVLFGLKALLLTFVYILLMWFFGLKNNEKELFINTIRRILSLKK